MEPTPAREQGILCKDAAEFVDADAGVIAAATSSYQQQAAAGARWKESLLILMGHDELRDERDDIDLLLKANTGVSDVGWSDATSMAYDRLAAALESRCEVHFEGDGK